MKKISIGVPCFNEEGNIEKMYDTLTEIMSKQDKYEYEIIFADNSSTDRSQEIIRDIAEKDKHVKAIFNSTNFGPDRSTLNMIRRNGGDAYITLACDFQDPPEMIPTFIEEWEKGHQIVWGQKNESKENPVKYALRNIYYSIIDFFSTEKQLRQCTGFGLMSREIINDVLPRSMQDPTIAWRYLVVGEGYDIKLIPYTQQKRLHGKSSYNTSRYFDFAMNSLINTSIRPLRVVTILGIVMSVFSFLIALVYLILKLVYWEQFNAGMAPVLIGVFFLGSIQLMCMGVIGEYIGAMMRKITPTAPVIEKELLNFDDEDK